VTAATTEDVPTARSDVMAASLDVQAARKAFDENPNYHTAAALQKAKKNLFELSGEMRSRIYPVEFADAP
jgi:hypothetical protein